MFPVTMFWGIIDQISSMWGLVCFSHRSHSFSFVLFGNRDGEGEGGYRAIKLTKYHRHWKIVDYYIFDAYSSYDLYYKMLFTSRLATSRSDRNKQLATYIHRLFPYVPSEATLEYKNASPVTLALHIIALDLS